MLEISDEMIIQSIHDSNIRKRQMEVESKKRNKLSDYFFSLSNTLLGSLVVGIILLVLGDDIINTEDWIILSVFSSGIVSVIILAKIGYNIIK